MHGSFWMTFFANSAWRGFNLLGLRISISGFRIEVDFDLIA
jgi:hypothetical protein